MAKSVEEASETGSCYRAGFEGYKLPNYSAPRGPFSVELNKDKKGKWTAILLPTMQPFKDKPWKNLEEAKAAMELKFEKLTQPWKEIK